MCAHDIQHVDYEGKGGVYESNYSNTPLTACLTLLLLRMDSGMSLIACCGDCGSYYTDMGIWDCGLPFLEPSDLSLFRS